MFSGRKRILVSAELSGTLSPAEQLKVLSSDRQGKVTSVTRVYDHRRKAALSTLPMLSFQLQAPASFFSPVFFLLLLHPPKLGPRRYDNIDFAMWAATGEVVGLIKQLVSPTSDSDGHRKSLLAASGRGQI